MDRDCAWVSGVDLSREVCTISSVNFQRAEASDAFTLAALRVRAMQPSLKAIGRFDPERA